MAIHDMKVERQALDARARAILDECPDVYRLIARGAAMEPEHDAIVYLRTALDPAPALTSARTKAELGKLPLTADIVAA